MRPSLRLYKIHREPDDTYEISNDEWQAHNDHALMRREREKADPGAPKGKFACFQHREDEDDPFCINDKDLSQYEIPKSTPVMRLPSGGSGHCLTREDVQGIYNTEGNPKNPYTNERTNKKALKVFLDEDERDQQKRCTQSVWS